MDLSRLVAAHCMDVCSGPGDLEKFFSCLFMASDWTSITSGSEPMTKAQEANVLLLFRAITNSFQDATPSSDMEWIKQVSVAFSFSGLLIQLIPRFLGRWYGHRIYFSPSPIGWH